MAAQRNIQPLPANIVHIGQMKNSEYLGSWDLPGDKRVKLTIKGVQLEEINIPNSSRKEEKWCLTFEKTPKRMVLNATNRKNISSWHGVDPHGWPGKEIELHRDITNLKGEQVECIRVTPNVKGNISSRARSASASIE
jgi:hypothetical protein